MIQCLMSCISATDCINILSAVSVFVAAVVAVFGINVWRREFVGKRRIELAEDTLSAFLEVKDAIAFIRSNRLGSPDEGATRKKLNAETYAETEQRNQAYVFCERYLKQEKIFSRFHRLKYRYMATFGSTHEDDFQTIESILTRLQDAWNDIDMLQAALERGSDMAKRKELVDKKNEDKSIFYEQSHGNDPIRHELDDIQARLEKVLKNTLRLKERRNWSSALTLTFSRKERGPNTQTNKPLP